MKYMAVAVLLLLAGASDPQMAPADAASEDLLIGPMRIASVEVSVSRSQPVEVYAHVIGIVGDSCSEAQPVQQARNGNTITIRLNRQRPAHKFCSQIAKTFDQNIRLLGEFAPGEYILKVNAVERKFQVP